MRIVVAADHNGVAMKRRITEWLRGHDHETDDRGTNDNDTVVDYPDLCLDACREVLDGRADRAILVGGAGGGEMIVCNRLSGIRAALGYSVRTTQISRTNNDSNVLILGAKVLDDDTAVAVVETWLATEFTGGRHQQRLDRIEELTRPDAR